MDGNQTIQPTIKKPTILNILRAKQKNEHQTTRSDESPKLAIDIDKLAREKVEEIEDTLNKLPDIKHNVLDVCFSMLKQIITAADLHRTNDGRNKNETEQTNKNETGDGIYADYNDDNEQLGASIDLSEQFATNSVKWTIRVHAFKIVHRIVRLLTSSNGTCRSPTPKLVKLLPDLVRLAFVAATSPYDELKLQGFEMFKFLIDKFALIEEKEFPGHSILEQYKTQVLSAVKPAFNLDAPPYTTAIASQICSLWICHRLEKDASDIKRTYQLMLQSIEKLDSQGTNQHSKLYTESELEQERVDILGSWAQLSVAYMETSTEKHHGRLFRLNADESDNLRLLIDEQISHLSKKWWEALKDFALLIMPSPNFIGAMHDNEHVYTREVALKLFEPVWPKLVLAQTYRLVSINRRLDQTETKYVQFLCGIILREFARASSPMSQINEASHAQYSTLLALKALHLLLGNVAIKVIFQNSLAMTREFHAILYNVYVHNSTNHSIKFLLRSILDDLFSLTLAKISDDSSCVHYAVAKLISLIMTTMKDIEFAIKQESSVELDHLRLHLQVRLRSLVLIFKNAPKAASEEAPLHEALITVFQEMLRFDQDTTVSLSLIDQISHLYPVMTEVYRSHMIDGLSLDLVDRTKKLAQSVILCVVTSNDLDKSKMLQLDASLHAFREMMKNSSDKTRVRLINSYLGLCNEFAGDLISKKGLLLESKNQLELFDYFVNKISIVEKDFGSNFSDESLCEDALQKYKAHKELQTDIRSKLDPRTGKLREVKKTITDMKSGPVKARTTKITLKADFSNFYNSKDKY